MTPPSAADDAASKDVSSEWTRVQPRKRNPRLRRLPGPTSASGPRDLRTPPNPAPQLDAQQIRRDHERIAAAGRGDSPCHARLRDLVAAEAASHVSLNTAICLGVGSFDPVPELYAQKRTAHVQLEAFRVMVEILETRNNSPIRCIIQEPGFSAADKEFCQSLGFEVVDTPRAFEMVDSHTLVYGIHLYLPIWAEALERNLPGCFVGTPFGVGERYLDTQDAGLDIGQIRAMDASFDQFPFPQDEKSSDFAFSDTVIYWAKR